jgi:hypothetical protein
LSKFFAFARIVGQYQPMHAVAHQIEIPLDQLERILLDHAREEFSGSVEVGIRLSPEEAVRCIEFEPETHESQLVRITTRSPAWREIGTLAPPQKVIDREALVRAAIVQSSGKLRLESTVRKVTGHFSNGELRKLEWVLPGETR